jgi:poly(3-hydroxybutyrate) depolymerase
MKTHSTRMVVRGAAVLCLATVSACAGSDQDSPAPEEVSSASQSLVNYATIQVDFGANVALPVGWNDAQGMIKASATGLSLKDSAGNLTGYTLKTTGSWNITHPYGTLSAAAGFGFPPEATKDAVYGNTSAYGGFSAPLGSAMEVSGLDTSVNYTFQFFCSVKKPGTDAWNRDTLFTLKGLTTVSGHVNCTNNDTVAVTLSTKPFASGVNSNKVLIEVTEGPANSTPNNEGFYHLNNFKLTYTPDYGTHTKIPITDPSAPPKGYWAYLPSTYNVDPAKLWPVIIALHGKGELGTGSSTDLDKLISSGTGLAATIQNGQFPAHHRFIVISPQDNETGGYMNPTKLASVVTFVKSHYRVDQTRMYLAGLSYGGRAAWDYVNANGSSGAFAAAIMTPGDGAFDNPLNCAKAGRIPIWSFHGSVDPDMYTSLAHVTAATNAINGCATPPIEPAKLTVYVGKGHVIWDYTYTLSGMTLATDTNWDPYSQDIYSWLLHRTK